MSLPSMAARSIALAVVSLVVGGGCSSNQESATVERDTQVADVVDAYLGAYERAVRGGSVDEDQWNRAVAMERELDVSVEVTQIVEGLEFTIATVVNEMMDAALGYDFIMPSDPNGCCVHLLARVSLADCRS